MSLFTVYLCRGSQCHDNMIIIKPSEAHLMLVGFKMGSVKIVLFGFAAFLAVGYADVVTITNCEETNEEICKIGEVRVVPCDGGKECVFRKGSDASLAFDFTPNFATSNLKTMVWWAQGSGDLAFTGFGSDNACEYTTCPSVPGQKQTVNYNLHLGKKLPKGSYNLKWKVWNLDNRTELCCFKFTIRLKNAKKN